MWGKYPGEEQVCGGNDWIPMEDTDIFQLKDEVLEKSNKDSFEMFKALKYKSQVVAGTNFFVKVQVHPEGECVHVRIFRPLPCNATQGKEVELTSLQSDKQLEDAVVYF